ncbi:MAG TPA: PadR family transcriptional regulator [Actinomycetales bacterium]|nr:PadR family transcriptional regulator [Actinomycetales bacterium]
MLDLAILGLLDERPMHGYELRKRLSEMLGTVRTVSFGSLYPTLRRLQQAGHIVEDASAATATRPPATARRGRKTYRITDDGRTALAALLDEPGAASFGDDGFGVHLAFFDRTPGPARIRLLEGRRRVLEERREGQRDAAGRAGPTELRYARQLTLLGLETSERELRWINELIRTENPSQGEPHHD